MVVPAPVGAIVPELPPGYGMVYADGIELYAVGGVYYRPVYRGSETLYQVVSPPNNLVTTSLESEGEYLSTYPNAGQTPEQEVKDRADCYHWAVEQSGFDPMTISERLQEQQEGLQHYNQAFSTCMQSRDYRVQ